MLFALSANEYFLSLTSTILCTVSVPFSFAFSCYLCTTKGGNDENEKFLYVV